MAKNKGILGKMLEHVTPDDDKEKKRDDSRNNEEHEERGGLLGKAVGAIKDRFDGDDEKQEERREQRPAGADVPIIGRVEAQAPASTPAVSTASADNYQPVGAASDHGQVTGSGLSRGYTTKEGDTLEAIAGYFYGDPVHRQRLLDDNPSLAQYSGPLPGGVRINVSEDASRGDAVTNSGY